MKKSTLLLSVFLLVAGCNDDSSQSPSGDTPNKAVPAPTAQGEPLGVAQTVTVGPLGGTVVSSDGSLSLTFPAGALSEDTAIVIQPISNKAQGGVGTAYRLEPQGIQLSQAVRLTFSYSDSEAQGRSIGGIGIATQTPEGYWQWMKSAVVDTNNKTISVDTNHFSDWSLVWAYQIRPPSQSVKVRESAYFRIVFCYDPKMYLDDKTISSLGYQCDPAYADIAPIFPDPGEILAWRVNGIDGGNDTLGTIAGSSISHAVGHYIAPQSRPNPDTVTVSGQFNWRGQLQIVTADITILDNLRQFSGSFQADYSDAGMTYHVSGTVNWSETSVDVFTASSVLAVEADLNGCVHYGGTNNFNGEMFLNVPSAGYYNFSLGTDANPPLLSCNGVDVPLDLGFAFSPMAEPDPSSAPTFDGTKLAGSSSAVGPTLNWFFSLN